MSDRSPLTRDLVLKVIREEAARMGVCEEDVIHRSRLPKAITARHLAIIRIREETGCSENALGRVWGIAPRTVGYACAKPAPLAPTGYDQMTRERLRWAHGEVRTAQIVEGHDPNTIRDLASWRRVIAHGRPM